MNNVEKNRNSAEQSKQAEIQKVIQDTRKELNPLQQFVEKVKTTISNFGNMLENAFSSFTSFLNGGKQKEKDPAPPPTQTEQYDYRGPYSIDYMHQHPFDAGLVMKQPLMDKVKENKTEFAQGLCNIAKKYGGRPEWYLAVIGNETAGTMSPSIQNPDTLATGLFQFMPETAKGLGTSVSKLKAMSNIQQLAYVDKYLTQVGATGKIHSLSDLYLAVFFPAALNYGGNSSYVFETKRLSAGKVARANPMFNKNKDGKITMREFKSVVNKTVGDTIHNVPLDYIA